MENLEEIYEAAMHKFVPINNYSPEKINVKLNHPEKIYIFDIDETLYEMDQKTHEAQHITIYNFLESTGLTRTEAIARTAELTEKHGLALKGVLKEYKITREQFKILQNYPKNAFSRIKKDHELRNILESLDGRKFCLTNSGKYHSFHVLNNLGVIDCIELIFHCDYKEDDFLIKPDPRVFGIIGKILGIERHHDVHYFDDRSVNVQAAIKHGWKGYIVDTDENHLKLLLRKLK